MRQNENCEGGQIVKHEQANWSHGSYDTIYQGKYAVGYGGRSRGIFCQNQPQSQFSATDT